MFINAYRIASKVNGDTLIPCINLLKDNGVEDIYVSFNGGKIGYRNVIFLLSSTTQSVKGTASLNYFGLDFNFEVVDVVEPLELYPEIIFQVTPEQMSRILGLLDSHLTLKTDLMPFLRPSIPEIECPFLSLRFYDLASNVCTSFSKYFGYRSRERSDYTSIIHYNMRPFKDSDGTYYKTPMQVQIGYKEVATDIALFTIEELGMVRLDKDYEFYLPWESIDTIYENLNKYLHLEFISNRVD